MSPEAKDSCRYVGYALTTQWEGQEASKLQMIGFDMGGTSTDVSRFAGSYEHVFESTTAGTFCTVPSLQASALSCQCLVGHIVEQETAHWQCFSSRMLEVQG